MTKLSGWFPVVLVLILRIDFQVALLRDFGQQTSEQKNKEDESHETQKQKLHEESRFGTNLHVDRNTRSTTLLNATSPQFKKICSGLGAQPCTCYYPDHPSVTLFQLDANEITKNASSENGTGPASCEDLQSVGYVLEGFYMVRFKANRVKAIYCNFNANTENISRKTQTTLKPSSKQSNKGTENILQFCMGFGSQPCTFLHPDYPDIPPINLRSHKTTETDIYCENCLLGPTSCDDLKEIGHRFNGFYIIRMNAHKVKIVFCDFKQLLLAGKDFKNNSSPNSKVNGDSSNSDSRFCKGTGSQPCSCYYSRFHEILQFEMSDDEITMNAVHENGAGPTSCKQLRQIGHNLDGFYMLRLTTKIMNIIYCKLPELEIKTKHNTEENGQINRLVSTPTIIAEIVTSPHAAPTVATTTSTISFTTPSTITTSTTSSTTLYITTSISTSSSTTPSIADFSSTTPSNTTSNTPSATYPTIPSSISPTIPSTTASTAPSTTPIIKKEPPKCNPNNIIYLLKNEEQDTCLEISKQNMLFLSKCDSFAIDQHWVKIITPKYSGMHIASSSQNKVLTVSTSHVSADGKAVVSLEPFRRLASSQKWNMNNGQKIDNYNIVGLKLTGYSNSSPDVGHFMVRMDRIGSKLQKWSFVPVRDGNNFTLCAMAELEYLKD